MLALSQLCEWLNLTERHAGKLAEREAIPYRKVGHLLRLAEPEIEEWSRPKPRHAKAHVQHDHTEVPAKPRRSRQPSTSEITYRVTRREQENGHAQRRPT
jgi:hypothetical protein